MIEPREGPALDISSVESEAWQAIEHLVGAAHRHLSMEAAFLAEVTPTEQLYRAAAGTAETFTITVGGALPRLEGFCHHMLTRGEPWIVPDAAEDPVAATVPVRTVGDFGAYIGVPVRRPDGRDYGSLCCINHDPQPDLAERDVAVLEALADVLGFHLGQLEEATDERRQLAADGEDLAARLRQRSLQLGLMSELVAAARTPAMVLDPVSLRIDYANPAAGELLDARPDQLVGARVLDPWLGWDEQVVRQRIAAVLDGDETVARFEVDDATDDRRILDVVVQRVETTGDSTAILLTGHDVTARRQAEQQLSRALERERAASSELRRLDSMRNAFLSAVSHELRTPLAAMRLVAETLQLGRVPPEMHGELLARLLAHADRLDRLLGDLLQLNQFTHGHLEVDLEVVRLDELARTAVAELDLADHELVLELDPVEAAVAPVKFERIVVNLVHNAQVHTEAGTITVRLTATDEGALLAVRDEGPGLPAEDRERLFRPFEQGPTAPAHRPGTGIGLSLVVAFADLHGGRVWAEDPPGGGARFCVLLPLEPGQGSAPDGPRSGGGPGR